jgi:hypothetical protein
MLVSHRKQFIYTKTAKTASTSVESYFEPWCQAEGVWEFRHAREETVSPAGIIGYRGDDTGGKTWFNHMAAVDIRRLLGDDTWDSYFKFAVIRDPFDKLLSGYFFSQRPTGTDEELITGFREWVKAGGAIIDRHTYTIDGKLCLDYFIRHEALEAGSREICDRLGLEVDLQRLPRLKDGFRQRHIPLAAYYDEEVKRIVSDLYAFELEAFGYNPPF